MKKAFCTLYDRCLYGCLIDLFIRQKFYFLLDPSRPCVLQPARASRLLQGPDPFTRIKLEFISSSFIKLSVQIRERFWTEFYRTCICLSKDMFGIWRVNHLISSHLTNISCTLGKISQNKSQSLLCQTIQPAECRPRPLHSPSWSLFILSHC